jgi:hypothetical protein
MRAYQEVILKIIGWMLGIRGEAKLVFIEFDEDEKVEPTINDLKRMQEESQMNRKDNGDDILKP